MFRLPSLRYEVLGLISRYPILFFPYISIRPDRRHLLVTTSSHLVIEGFPRCANTFSVLAFEMAQGRKVEIAHHLHAEAQVKRALSLRIPVLVVTREPVAAITSLVTRHPEITVRQALRQYLRFYGYIERCASQLVIADFGEVTTCYANVIGRLNRRYGTDFLPYVNEQEQDARVFAMIDQINLAAEGSNAYQLARPSAKRAKYLKEVYRQIEGHPMVPRLRDLHSRLTSTNDPR